MKTLGVVIPVYNAHRSIEAVAEGVLTRFERMGIRGRLVLVDDGSTDGSDLLLRRLAATHENLTAVRLTRNCGQQAALLCGLSFLKDCAFCATMDDDLQHPDALLAPLLERAQMGDDLVYAVPQGVRRPILRRLGSLGRDALFALFTKKPRGVRVSSYRMMRAPLVQKLLAERQSSVYLSASAFRYRPRTSCIPFQPSARAYGTSGYNPRRLAAVYWKLFVYYTPPGRFFRPPGFTAPYEIAEIFEGGTSFEQTDDSGRLKLPKKRPTDRKASGA